mmetsp:Transcript_20938/g.29345  ORF Transcript_20938/g.29345 Transcript_20938/m.29345 type:complete len:115 (+) Transcript_20938:352-696(+)
MSSLTSLETAAASRGSLERIEGKGQGLSVEGRLHLIAGITPGDLPPAPPNLLHDMNAHRTTRGGIWMAKATPEEGRRASSLRENVPGAAIIQGRGQGRWNLHRRIMDDPDRLFR